MKILVFIIRFALIIVFTCLSVFLQDTISSCVFLYVILLAINIFCFVLLIIDIKDYLKGRSSQ